MFTEERSDDYSPLAVVGKFSIYVTELLIIIHIVCLVLFSLWPAFTGAPLGETSLDAFTAYLPAWVVGKFQIWRLVTYVFQNYPSLWFAVGMFMLWWFGREVEKFYGRRNFFISYVVLTVVPALVGLLPIFGFGLAGPSNVHFGVFLMFAATYPGVMFFLNIQAKWLAWIYLAIFTLLHLGRRDVSGLVLLWLTAFLAFGMTRWLGRGDWLPERLQTILPSFNKPKLTVLRPEQVRPKVENKKDAVSEIDPILEKIARSGLGSLNEREHAALRAASGELQKNNRR